MSTLLEHIAADLRVRAGFLLEAGKDGRSSTAAALLPAPLETISGALQASRNVVALIAALLDEAAEFAPSSDRLERSSSPVRAIPPRSASAYDVSEEGDLVPRHWLRPVEATSTALGPLRWLMYLLQRLEAKLRDLETRVYTQLEELTAAQGHLDSEWSREELASLEALVHEIRRGREGLVRARRTVTLQAGRAVSPTERLPRPYPQGRAWQTLRRMYRYWLDPARSLANHLENVLAEPLEGADLPFLYERWCAVQLLDAFERRGWTPSNQQKALWSVFLGGQIQLHRAENPGEPIDLWIEPRIGGDGHPSGLSTSDPRHEQSPDIVINITTREGVESVILDPTLGRTTDHLAGKDKYVTALKRSEVRTIAGISVIKNPRRSWAMAPLDERSCRLLRGTSESAGVVPMLPGDFATAPIDAFLDDLLSWT